MEILRMIVFILSGVTYGVMVAFTIATWFRMRRQEDEINELKKMQANAFMLIFGDHLRNNLVEVGKMKADFHALIKAEQYEQAEKLKAIIASAEENTSKMLGHFRKIFGEDAFKIETFSDGQPKE